MHSSNSRRGMNLESMINKTIDLYRTKKLALIQKIPTPISPGKFNAKTKKLEGAFFMEKSTVDYIGLVQEIPICFDAKETKTDRFPLANIKLHQLEFMKDWEAQGGVSFLLIYFSKDDLIYYVPYRDITKIIKNCKKNKASGFTRNDLNDEYIINVKGKITFPFLQKIQLDIENR